ncbi:MAG: peptidase M28, partial [Azospira oryzae]
MKLYFFLLITLCVFYSSEIPAQQKPNTGAVDVIKMEELKRDLYAMADDRFKGRESGTLDELKVSVWLAEQARLAGLEPAGDDGTFFQFFPLQRTRLSSLNSSVTAGDRSYLIFKDALPMISAAASVAAPTVYIADFAAIASLDLKDKIAVVPVSSQGINQNVSIPGRRYFRSVYQKYAPALINKGVAAIILIGDEEA